MIGAVVSDGPLDDNASDEGRAASSVADQLGRLRAAVRLVTTPGAGAAATLEQLAACLESADGPVAVVPADLHLHDAALAELLDDPRAQTRALVASASDAPDVRLAGGRVVSAGSSVHVVSGPDAAFTGAIVVDPADLPVAVAAAREAVDVAARSGWDVDPVQLLLVALVRRDVPVAAVGVDPWPWLRGGSGDDVRTLRDELHRLDPHRVRLARATRPDDGLYATLVIRRLSRRLTPVALRLGLRPNQITVLSLAVGLAAAGCFAVGDRAALVAGALLLQLSLVVDCVDGEVARYTRAFSSLGAWLDASTDRVKEFACYAGLAVGAAGDGVDLWLLAAAMLTLQTTRHTTDYTFTAVKDLRESTGPALPLDQPDDGVTSFGEGGASRRAVQASERSNRRAAVRWAKKVVHMQIGERWLVISVVAVFGTPRLVFGVLLGLGLVSLAYTSVGRALRARTWPDRPTDAREQQVVRAQFDGGPLVAGLARRRQRPIRLTGRYLWTLPPALRLAEYAAVLALVSAAAPEASSAAFALLFVVAYHHYDDLYRVLNRLSASDSVRLLGLGADGRLLVVAVLAGGLGAAATQVGLWVLAAWLCVVFVGIGTVGALQDVRLRRAATTEVVGA